MPEDDTDRRPSSDEFVVVAPRPGVQVYENPNAMIVVRNFGDERSEDEMCYVLIHPDDADKVVKEILAVRDGIRKEG